MDLAPAPTDMGTAYLDDVRLALRILTRYPSYSVVALAVLALSVGVNAAIFSLVYSVLLSPLPYPESSRLVVIRELNPGQGRSQGPSPPNFRDWRRHSRLFESLAASTPGSLVVRQDQIPRMVASLSVSPGFLSTLGAGLDRGRGFGEPDAVPGSEQVAVVSHGFWRNYLGGDPAPLGRRVETAHKTLTVVGVLPRDFYYPDPVEVLIPLSFSESQLTDAMRGARYLQVLGRLARNASETSAAAELESITSHSPMNREWKVQVTSLHEQVVGGARSQLTLLAAAVVLLLLVACANVGGLTLSRMAQRSCELGLRTALGASRFRLVRQILTEIVVLFVAGGMLGLLLAGWSLETLLAIAPRELPRTEHIGMDLPVLIFAVAISLVSGLLFGLFPALNSTRRGLDPARPGGRSPASQMKSRRLLVIAEVALSLVLLVASGLMVRSLINLQRVDPGFNPDQTVTFFAAPSPTRYPSDAERELFVRQVVDDISALPQVRRAGAGTNLPLSGSAMSFGFTVPGSRDQARHYAQYHAVTPGYFPTLGIETVSGRGFQPHDRADSRPVAIVNQALARQFWPRGDALGGIIRHSSRTGLVEREIVGVVEDIRHSSLQAGAGPEIYVPFAQDPWHFFSVVARLDDSSAATLDALRRRVWRVDDTLPLDRIERLDQWLARSQAPLRFRTLLLGFFAASALLLACIGIYGILSFLVSQSTREIGVRMALGAKRGRILQEVLRRGMGMVAAGTVLGLFGALAGGRLLSSFLYEVEPLDGLTLAGVTALLLVSAAVACCIPAGRAIRIDPADALRHE